MPYIIVKIPEHTCASCPLYIVHDLAEWCALEFVEPARHHAPPERPKACRDAELRHPEYVGYDCNPEFACSTHGRCWTHSEEENHTDSSE